MGYYRLHEDERRGIMALDQLSRSFEVACERLDRKLTGYKYLKRDVGQVQALCRRLMREAIKDVDPVMALQIARQSRDYVLDSVRRTVVPKGEVILAEPDLSDLLDAVLSERCQYCMKNQGEADVCPTRKLIHKFVDEPDPGMMTCGYVHERMRKK